MKPVSISNGKIADIAKFASKAGSVNSAWVFGFSELARHVLDGLGVEKEKKIKALNLFESGFVTRLYSYDKTSRLGFNHADKIKNGLNISRELLKKDLDNPHVKRFEAAYSRGLKTGKKEVFVTGEELQLFNHIFTKSRAKILEDKNEEFEKRMSKYGGRLVLELGKRSENRVKSAEKWVH